MNQQVSYLFLSFIIILKIIGTLSQNNNSVNYNSNRSYNPNNNAYNYPLTYSISREAQEYGSPGQGSSYNSGGGGGGGGGSYNAPSSSYGAGAGGGGYSSPQEGNMYQYQIIPAVVNHNHDDDDEDYLEEGESNVSGGGGGESSTLICLAALLGVKKKKLKKIKKLKKMIKFLKIVAWAPLLAIPLLPLALPLLLPILLPFLLLGLVAILFLPVPIISGGGGGRRHNSKLENTTSSEEKNETFPNISRLNQLTQTAFDSDQCFDRIVCEIEKRLSNNSTFKSDKLGSKKEFEKILKISKSKNKLPIEKDKNCEEYKCEKFYFIFGKGKKDESINSNKINAQE